MILPSLRRKRSHVGQLIDNASFAADRMASNSNGIRNDFARIADAAEYASVMFGLLVLGILVYLARDRD